MEEIKIDSIEITKMRLMNLRRRLNGAIDECFDMLVTAIAIEDKSSIDRISSILHALSELKKDCIRHLEMIELLEAVKAAKNNKDNEN